MPLRDRLLRRATTGIRARRLTAGLGRIDGWRHSALGERLAAPVVLRSYAGSAVVALACPVDADYVVRALAKWARHVGEREPLAHNELATVSAELWFKPFEIRHISAALPRCQ